MKSRTIGGMVWSFIERFGVQLINALVTIVVANFVAPEYFGVFVTVAILLEILAVITEGGLGAALVQRPQITRDDVSTAFYFNLLASLTVLAIMLLTRSMIAEYFEEPLLESVLPWLAVGLVVAAAGQSQEQMFVKNLEFRKLAMISFPSTLIGGISGIGLALLGWDIWALVAMRLAKQVFNTVFLWWRSPIQYKPNFRFRRESAKKLFGLSMGILGGTLIARITRNLIGLIIMKNFGAAEAGFYSQARFFQKAPTEPLLHRLESRTLSCVFRNSA